MLFVIALPISFTRESLLQLSKSKFLQRKKNVLRTLVNSRTKTSRKKKTFNSTRWWYFQNYSGHSVERLYIIVSITPGKKFLAFPSVIYDRMIKHSAESYQPKKNELIKSEEEMQNIWNTSVPSHEKVKQFTKELKKI